MNFFERQTQMRTLSKRLVLMFALAVLAIVVIVDAVLLTAWSMFNNAETTYEPLPLPNAQWLSAHPGAIVMCTLIVLAVIGLSSLYKILQLRTGGSVVAIAAGGQLVPNNVTDPKLRMLLNVVEEIAIASGTPIPTVYVIPNELGINAFTSGYNPSNAAIAVTQGCVDHLTRSELQAVIAHEFSHIVNRDIELNSKLMGLLFGILVIAIIGRFLLRFAPHGRGRKGGNRVMVIVVGGAVLFAAGYVGLFFGRMIQAAVSRKRESLADASAVQFTRDPTALRNALVKIGALAEGSKFVNSDPQQVAHMLFAPGMSQLLQTHPPLIERIKAIDPRFNPSEFEKTRLTASIADKAASSAPPQAANSNAKVGMERLNKVLAATTVVSAANIASAVNAVGSTDVANLALAQSINESLPHEIAAAADQAQTAIPLMFSLALDTDVALREQQLTFIGAQLGQATAQQCRALLVRTDQLNALQRQPVLLRLLRSLRALPSNSRADLLRCLNGLLQRSGGMSLSKYGLRKLAQIQLRDVSRYGSVAPRYSVSTAQQEIAQLLAVLARFGNIDPAKAAQAYAAGMTHLYAANVTPMMISAQWPATLDAALNKLDLLTPPAKQQLLEAMIKTISHDNTITANETEIVRIACATLHCPLPPVVMSAA
jgi:Zn-dependent protease with chaperone function